MRWRCYFIIPLGAALPLLVFPHLSVHVPSLRHGHRHRLRGVVNFYQFLTHTHNPLLIPPHFFFAIFLMCSQFMIYRCVAVFSFPYPGLASVELCGPWCAILNLGKPSIFTRSLNTKKLNLWYNFQFWKCLLLGAWSLAGWGNLKGYLEIHSFIHSRLWQVEC